MQPGKYLAKVSDYGVKETKNGNPYIEVWFDVEGQGSVRWNGFLTEKTINKTMEQLAYCGLKGDFSAIADGPIGGALDRDQAVNITVEIQKDKEGNPTKYTQVKWINRASQPKFDAVQTASAKGKLTQFSGAWAAKKAELGIKPKNVAPEMMKSKDVGF